MSFEKKGKPSYTPLSQNENVTNERSSQVILVPAQPMVFMYNGQLATQTPQQIAVTIPPMTYPTVSIVKPPGVTPNTHLVLSFVMLVILMLLAPEAMIFIIPALILAIMSNNAVNRGDYAQGKKLGHGALALNFIGLIFSFVVAIVCVAVSMSLNPWRRGYDYVDYYYGGCFYDYDYDAGSGVDRPPMICY